MVCAASCSGSVAAQTDAGRPLAFDVASVRQNKGEDLQVSSNVPLGPGNVYVPTGGVFSAKNMPLMVYVGFAYRMTDAQEEALVKQAPAWMLHDRFDVEARTEAKDVTKDDLRLMVRALLVERFALKVHPVMKEMEVYALVPVRQEEMGPGLRRHAPEADCSPTGKEMKAEWPDALPGGFPRICGAILGLPAVGAGHYRLGGSGIGMGLLVASMTGWGGLQRPVVDRTGITGKVDFVLEYAPQGAPDKDAEGGGPTFQEALRKQLGLKLEAGRAPVELLVLDGVGRLVEN